MIRQLDRETDMKKKVKKFGLGWVLWYINHYRLSNAKSCLQIYIKYIGFG